MSRPSNTQAQFSWYILMIALALAREPAITTFTLCLAAPPVQLQEAEEFCALYVRAEFTRQQQACRLSIYLFKLQRHGCLRYSFLPNTPYGKLFPWHFSVNMSVTAACTCVLSVMPSATYPYFFIISIKLLL